MNSIPLYGVVNLPEMEIAAIDVLRSGQIANGKYVADFEKSFGDLIGQKNVVSTSDMTSAMLLALHLAGVSEGDEVLTTSFACLATNSAIAQLKAIPVWVDLSHSSIDMNVDDLSSKISKSTKAIILYHVAGYPGPMTKLRTICDLHQISLIEDCDNALLAVRDSVMVGSLGDFAIYSFYPNRQINGTEGGALVCKNPDHASLARRLRRFGIDPETFRDSNGEINPNSDVPEIGWSIGMSNLASAVALQQLPTVIERLNQTRINAQLLHERIAKIKDVDIIPAPKESAPAYWAFLVLVKNRDEVLSELKAQGIKASVIHSRNDVYTGFHSVSRFDLPNTKHIQDNLIGLPVGWWLDLRDIDLIALILAIAVKKNCA